MSPQGERGLVADGGVDGQDGVRHRNPAVPAAAADRQVGRHKAPAADAAAHRVGRREDADQLDGALHVQLPEGVLGLVAVPALQGDQVPDRKGAGRLGDPRRQVLAVRGAPPQGADRPRACGEYSAFLRFLCAFCFFMIFGMLSFVEINANNWWLLLIFDVRLLSNIRTL